MRVRFLLAIRIGAGPGVLNERARGLEAAIAIDWQAGDRAAAVVGDQNILARAIDIDVAWAVADRRLLIQRRQRARGRVDRKRADRALLLAGETRGFIHAIKKTPIRMNGHKAWALDLRCEFRSGRYARAVVEIEFVNAFAGIGRSVGADIHRELFGLKVQGGKKRKDRKKYSHTAK